MQSQNLPGYTLVRSDRRTLSVEVARDGTMMVRAPRRCSQRDIAQFVASHAEWIAAKQTQQRARAQAHPEPTEAQRLVLQQRAHEELPAHVAHYAARMGLSYTGVTITGARTRFGSCSAKNSLCFSWRLMQYPDAAIEYVVVHELAHIVHKNHGKEFYALIASILPDYRARVRLLRG